MHYLINLWPLYELYKGSTLDIYSTIKSLKNSSKYQFPKECQTDLNLSLQPIFQKFNIKNIEIVPSFFDFCPGFAGGTSFFANKEKLLSFNFNVYQIDSEAAKAVAIHELGHIVNNDTIKNPIIVLISSLAINILLSKIGLTCIPIFLITAISLVAIKIFSARLDEIKADNFALANSTEEEVKGQIRILKAAKQVEKTIFNQSKFPYLTSFLSLIFSDHPSMKSRLNKFKNKYKEITLKKCEFNDEEKKKIEALKLFLTPYQFRY